MEPGEFRVHNFEVERKHTYYVGNARVLVHNDGDEAEEIVRLFVDLTPTREPKMRGRMESSSTKKMETEYRQQLRRLNLSIPTRSRNRLAREPRIITSTSSMKSYRKKTKAGKTEIVVQEDIKPEYIIDRGRVMQSKGSN